MKEQAPGTFRYEDDEDIETPASLVGRKKTGDGYFERIKKLADELRASMTVERIAKVFDTECLRDAFNSIKTSTFSQYELADLEKKSISLEIREKRILDQELLKKYPAVYAGSDVDVEYPLTLGVRHLIMVDPELSTERTLARLRERLGVVSKGNYKQTEKGFEFVFDFGEGDETVQIQIEPHLYGKVTAEFIEKFGKFTPPKEISMLIAFQSGDPTQDAESLGRVVSGGYVLSNNLDVSSCVSSGEFEPISLESFKSDNFSGLLRKKDGKI